MSKNCVQKWKNVRCSHIFIHRKLKICQNKIWVENPALSQVRPKSMSTTHFMGKRSKNLFCWLWGPIVPFPKFSKWHMKIWLEAKILTYLSHWWVIKPSGNFHLKKWLEKKWHLFGGLPGPSIERSHFGTRLKKIFVYENQNGHHFWPKFLSPSGHIWHQSRGGFCSFWPPVPRRLAAGALTKGHPKYLWGATKWPPSCIGQGPWAGPRPPWMIP